jgi:hypothetical protein
MNQRCINVTHSRTRHPPQSLKLFWLSAELLLQLFNSSGELIDSNDNWNDHSPADSLRRDLQPSRSTESAITRTLASGAYTAIVRGAAGSAGIGIVEVFEID